MPNDPFVDLEIRLWQRLPEGYPIEITLGGQQEFPRGYLAPDVLPWSSSGDLAADGQRLFNTLVADPNVREAWAQARGQSAQRRIRLRIDPAAAELHALPWELLHDGTNLLAAHADTPFSRYLPIALPWRGAIAEHPIKVLIAISNPDDLESKYDLPPADVALEEEILEAAFEGIDPQELRIDFLDEPITLERLEERLRKGYHLLHFLGHGAFNARRGQAALYLQDDEHHAQRVIDEEIAGMLARQGVQPRLVFLAACQSAARSTADAYLGLAPKLVAAGVPAVLAMQEAITVKTVRRFSAAFYQRLVEHGQVDRAVNEARSTLLTAGRPDAAVPVLFMRLKSSRLWGEELTDVPPPPEPPHPPVLSSFVGREAELARSQQQLAAQRVVLIAGMPGIGKTALAAELARRSGEARKIFWHEFQKNEDLLTTLWQLAGFLAWNDQPDLWRMLQHTRQTGKSPPAHVLLDYAVQLLRERDYLMCFDDAHRIEAETEIAQFIRRLQSLAGADRLRLICTAQNIPTFVSGSAVSPLEGFTLEETRAFLAQHGLNLAVSADLSRVDVQDTHGLRRAKVLLPEEIVVTLHARTGGNPLFLTLAADGLKRAQSVSRYLARLFADQDIKRFLVHQIDASLTEAERAVMQALASLLGYSATREAVEAIVDGPSVGRILGGLSDRQLIAVKEGEAEREYALNTIVRTFYYDELSKRERQLRHLCAAAYYEKEAPDRFRAALHYEAGGQPEQAAALIVDDVNEFIGRGQARGLGYLLERINAIQLQPEVRVKVNLARGEVSTAQGHSEAARDAFQTALMLLNTMYSKVGLDSSPAAPPEIRLLYARAYLGIGALLEYEDPPEALAWLKRGLEMIADSNTTLEAVLWIRLGSVQLGMGQYAEAQRSTERSLRGLSAWLDHWRAVALMNLGIICWKRNEHQRAADFYQRALAIYEQLNDYWGIIPLQLDRGIEFDRAGQWPQAVECFQVALDRARQLGAVRYETTLELAFGIIHTKLGNDDLAQAHLRRCLELAREHTLNEALVAGLSSLSDWRIRHAEWDAAQQVIDEAEPLALEMDARGQLPELWRGRALIHLARGQIDQARETIEKTIALCRKLDLKIDEGISWRVLGQVFSASGQLDQAIGAFEQSLTLVQDDVYEVARTQLEWGHALRAADPQRAEELLQAARSTFEQLGAKRDRAACDAG